MHQNLCTLVMPFVVAALLSGGCGRGGACEMPADNRFEDSDPSATICEEPMSKQVCDGERVYHDNSTCEELGYTIVCREDQYSAIFVADPKDCPES
jgi:hypothetical protein